MSDQIQNEIRSLVLQPNYPCTAAVQAIAKKEFVIREYGVFGEGGHWREMRADLLAFLEQQRASGSRFLTFFAVFGSSVSPESEAEFEDKLWRELSFISEESDWRGGETLDPQDKSFCLNLGGERIFVVGLHPLASRKARVFSRPVLVFNAFSQFEIFEKEGTYEALVETIRRRDVKFQGSVNPMVKAFGDFWEAIQFSGRTNDGQWKCPFAFLHRKEKPS